MRKYIFLGMFICIVCVVLFIFLPFSSYKMVQEKVHSEEIDHIIESLSQNNQPVDDHPSAPTTTYYYYSESPHTGSARRSFSSQEQSKEMKKLVKYVLFSIIYDPEMNEGETKSLQLKMSARDLRSNLNQLLSARGWQQENVRDFINKVEDRFKYVSADLTAKNGCLRVEKKRPSEDRVYLLSANESQQSQLWQWDLTAPKEAIVNPCRLSLFIRFCENQSDCIPTEDPDKEIIIGIKINLINRFFGWIQQSGGIASALAVIITLLVTIKGWCSWKKKD